MQALAFVPFAPTLLLAGDANGALLLWDVHVRRPLLRRGGAHSARGAGVLSVRVLPSGSVLTQARDGILKLWHLHVTPQEGTSQVLTEESATFTTTDMKQLCVHLSREPSLKISTNSYNFCTMSAIPWEGVEVVAVAGP